ncbi:MAG: hypothetical protein QOI76_2882 [Frankiales bacterium]|nr:hypothetical protein [Frankiales bacterium]
MQDDDRPDDRFADELPGRTGDEQVDLAMERLAGLDELPLAAQVTVFDDVHRLLQDALTGTDQPATGTPGR